MFSLKRLSCRDTSAVVQSQQHDLVVGKGPSCFDASSHISEFAFQQQQANHNLLLNDSASDFPFKDATAEPIDLEVLEATESETEVDTDFEEEEDEAEEGEEKEVEDAPHNDVTAAVKEEDEEESEEATTKSKPQGFSFASLLGPELNTNYSKEAVPTNDALSGAALVAIYYANADKCKRSTELLSIFDAGYEYKSLDIVYCNSISTNEDDSTDNAGGFDEMPVRWWAVPSNKTFQSERVKQLGLLADDDDDEEPCLIVLDPNTGNVLSSTALEEITELDPTDEDYDEEGNEIFEDWIFNLGLEQLVVGDMEIELKQKEQEEGEEEAIERGDDDDDALKERGGSSQTRDGGDDNDDNESTAVYTIVSL